jgi:hypothetical protein
VVRLRSVCPRFHRDSGLSKSQISNLRISLEIRFGAKAEVLLRTAMAAIQRGAQRAECRPGQRTDSQPIFFKANSF